MFKETIFLHIMTESASRFPRQAMNYNQHKLGLPLEYQQIPEYFDAHNINEQTDAKNAVIEKLLKNQNIKTVLDMTCGTGSQVFYLADRGYEVIGSDFSPALIAKARKKATELQRTITFIDGDMRTLQAGKFDAVITIFNAIGHLTKADFEITLQNIRANLKDNGLYIFDIFNLQAITDKIIHDFAMDIESVINGDTIHNVQHSEIDRENGLLTSHDHYTISKQNGSPETYTNSFSLQIYTAAELQKILAHNGFEVLSQYDMDGNDFVAEKSLNILTVARAKHG
jgi:2-polyprenyl-3-methyl-5-hydroxy-6-metoxy-1,4-benzoquinol methylase